MTESDKSKCSLFCFIHLYISSCLILYTNLSVSVYIRFICSQSSCAWHHNETALWLTLTHLKYCIRHRSACCIIFLFCQEFNQKQTINISCFFEWCLENWFMVVFGLVVNFMSRTLFMFFIVLPKTDDFNQGLFLNDITLQVFWTITFYSTEYLRFCVWVTFLWWSNKWWTNL